MYLAFNIRVKIIETFSCIQIKIKLHYNHEKQNDKHLRTHRTD